jgi:hypothetical protein
MRRRRGETSKTEVGKNPKTPVLPPKYRRSSFHHPGAPHRNTQRERQRETERERERQRETSGASKFTSTLASFWLMMEPFFFQ